MKSTEWNKIKSIISTIIEAPEAEQAKLLEQVITDNPSISESLQSHFSSIKESDGFWKETIEGSSDLIQNTFNLDEFESIPVVEYKQGSRIGAYILDEQIGKGGMGIVFKANRADGQFERVVAIKLMALHIQFEEVQKRFEQEQKILASLNHPNIAQLYDAGVTAAGSPYLVMEFVEGEDVLSYAKRNDLSINDRVSLFLKICEAVEFAHRNLVIHRDLKPANILVTDEGNLKVLDFGIAKLMTDSMDTVSESITQHQQRIYSLSYASPEQVLGNPINTSTDVYTLGLLLHELLTDSRLYHLDGVSRKEAEEKIINQDFDRALDNGRVQNQDLDAIIQKSIRIEPDSRYNSVTDLHLDLDRYINNEPVQARKGSTLYKVSKFWKRNKAWVSVASIILVAILLFSIFYTVQINEERIIAQNESEKAQQITEFLIDLFQNADPLGEGGKDISVADFVEGSIYELYSLSNQPEIQLQAVYALARVTGNLANFTQSELLYTRALFLADSLKSEPKTQSEILFYYGELKRARGDFRESISYLDSAIILASTVTTDFHLSIPEMQMALASAYAHIDKIEEADSLMNTALGAIEENEISLLHIESLTAMADISREKQNYEASISFELQKISYLEQYFPKDSAKMMYAFNNIGVANRNIEQYEEALNYYSKTLILAEGIYGRSHPNVLTTLNNVAVVHRMLGQKEDVLTIRLEILDRTIEQFGEIHWRTGSAYGSVSEAQIELGLDDALASMITSISIYQETLGSNHFWTLRQQLRLAAVQFLQNDVESAESLAEDIVELLKQTTTAPLAYYDKTGLEAVLRNYEEKGFDFGYQQLSNFFDWYSSEFES